MTLSKPKLSWHQQQISWGDSEITGTNLAKCVEINSLKSSDAYIHLWTRSSLVEIMACCRLSAKPLHQPMLTNCPLDYKEHISMNFYIKNQFFTHEGTYKNVVCKIAAILSQPQNVMMKECKANLSAGRYKMHNTTVHQIKFQFISWKTESS